MSTVTEESDLAPSDAKFAKARNIRAITISQAKRVITQAFRVQRVLNKRATVVNMEGEAGIGKTHAVYQIATDMATELAKPVHVINWKLMSREKEDVGGYPRPTSIEVGLANPGGSLARQQEVHCFEYVPERLLAEVQASGYPAILFFDEWPRADRAVCSVMFGCIEDGQLGSFRIPDNWYIVAASNPSDGYQGNGIDSDHAYRRRFCWTAVAFDFAEFIAHIKAVEFHPAVVAFCSGNKDICLDVQARNQGFVYANPAAWEKVSDFLTVLDSQTGGSIFADFSATMALGHFCGGLVGQSVATLFVNFARKFMEELTPADILHDYTKVRSKLLTLVSAGRNDILSALAIAVVETLYSERPGMDVAKISAKGLSTVDGVTMPRVAHNFGTFIADLPMDISAAALGPGVKDFRDDPECARYVRSLNAHLARLKAWKEMVKRRQDALDAGMTLDR